MYGCIRSSNSQRPSTLQQVSWWRSAVSIGAPSFHTSACEATIPRARPSPSRLNHVAVHEVVRRDEDPEAFLEVGGDGGRALALRYSGLLAQRAANRGSSANPGYLAVTPPSTGMVTPVT